MRYKAVDTVIYLWITAQLITIFDRLYDYFFLRDKQLWLDLVLMVLGLYAVVSIVAVALNVAAFIWLIRRYRKYGWEVHRIASAFCMLVTGIEIVLIGYVVKFGLMPI